MITIIVIIVMTFRHIPTMTKSHHGGNMSVMNMVEFCHWSIPTINDDYDDDEAGIQNSKYTNVQSYISWYGEFLKAPVMFVMVN